MAEAQARRLGLDELKHRAEALGKQIDANEVTLTLALRMPLHTRDLASATERAWLISVVCNRKQWLKARLVETTHLIEVALNERVIDAERKQRAQLDVVRIY